MGSASLTDVFNGFLYELIINVIMQAICKEIENKGKGQ